MYLRLCHHSYKTLPMSHRIVFVTSRIVAVFVISSVGLVIHANAQMPNWGWGVSVHGTQNDPISILETDLKGNVFLAGNFGSPALTIRNSMLINAGESSIFNDYAAVINADGSLRWSKLLHNYQSPYTFSEVQILSAFFDVDGGVLILGDCNEGELQVDGYHLGMPDAGKFNFLLKFSADGYLEWYHLFTGSDFEPIGIESDALGGFFLAGILDSWCLSLDLGGYVLVNEEGKTKPFIGHFNEANVADWAFVLDERTVDFSIVGNNLGDIYFSGGFDIDTYSIGNIALVLSAPWHDEYFVGRCNRQGAVEYATTISAQNESILACEPFGKELYIWGNIEDELTIIGADTINALETDKRFLVHLNDQGLPVYADTLPGNYDADEMTFAVSPTGLVTIGVILYDSFPINGDTLVANPTCCDPLVVSFQEPLEPISGFLIPMEWPSTPRVLWDTYGNIIYQNRFYQDTLIFGLDTLINIQLSTQSDYFIAKSSNCSTIDYPITATEFGLVAPEGLTYQWYFNNMLIPGAISQTYLPLEYGMYSVHVQFEDGCFGWGAPYNWSIGQTYDELAILVFPNPAVSSVHILYPGTFDYCMIFDAIGNLVSELPAMPHLDTIISLSASGMYFVELGIGDKQVYTKFIIL